MFNNVELISSPHWNCYILCFVPCQFFPLFFIRFVFNAFKYMCYSDVSQDSCNLIPLIPNRFQPSYAMWRHIFHLFLICTFLPTDSSSHLNRLRWLFYAWLYMLKSPNIWTKVPVLSCFAGATVAEPTKHARTGTFVHHNSCNLIPLMPNPFLPS
jgi:hypothetical protein